MEALASLKSPSGHDAYCHVCWEPVYRFWVSKESPDHARCPVGDYTAQTCPNATGPAKMRATIEQLKRDGLWCGNMGLSLARRGPSAIALSPAAPEAGQ